MSVGQAFAVLERAAWRDVSPDQILQFDRLLCEWKSQRWGERHAVVHAAQLSTAEVLDALDKPSEAKRCRWSVPLKRISLTELAERMGDDDEKLSAFLSEPFVAVSKAHRDALSTRRAQAFMAVYTALHRDQQLLNAKWRACDYEFLADPMEYDIVQCAINTINDSNEYLSMTKTCHGHQFTGSHCLSRNQFNMAVMCLWEALKERVFKTSAYFYGGPDFGLSLIHI